MADSRLGLTWQVKVCNLLLVQDLGLVWAVGDTQTCLLGKMFPRQRDQEEPPVQLKHIWVFGNSKGSSGWSKGASGAGQEDIRAHGCLGHQQCSWIFTLGKKEATGGC